MCIKEDMPLLARHEGVWDGTYRHYDAARKHVDEHQSRVICRFPDGGPEAYVQTNQYSWTDGRSQSPDCPAIHGDGRLWWDKVLIKGWATELSLYLYEMIQLSGCGKKRLRTWQWIRDGEIEAPTTIDKKLVTRDWRRLETKLKKAA